MQVTLMAYRAADLPLRFPGSDESRCCSQCRAPVVIAPSGRLALRTYEKVQIVCTVCVARSGQAFDYVALAPGALREIEGQLRRN